MSRRRSPLIALLGAGLLAAGALTGCATGASSSPAETGPSPDATTPAPGSETGAAWVEAGRSIAVVTWGSSSCVPRASGVPSVVDGALTVTLDEAQQDVCTADFAPRATLIPVPAGVDATADLTVKVTGAAEGTVTLRGLKNVPTDGEQFVPSAGWVDSSLVAIVTYGSSSCVPAVQAVSSAGDDVEVQFATPPADQVCTMDYAPRVSLADIGREAGEGDVSLVLSGGGVASSGPIPVLGTR